MATPLTRAHHRWRIQIFATTWFTYVAFYFCRKPFSAAKAAIQDETGWSTATLGELWATYLVTYAIGQFLASHLGTRLGPRRNVLLGMLLSILVTLAMGVTLSVPGMFALLAINGLAQATGWSGTVGTMASWFHKHERGRVMGAWSTNFTIGSITSGFAMAWVLSFRDTLWDIPLLGKIMEPAPWRWCFYAGAFVLVIALVQFYLLQRNTPEDVGLAAVDDPVTAVDESRLPGSGGAAGEDPKGSRSIDVPEPRGDGPMGLSRDAWRNLLLVAGFYFFVKFVRYAVWSWSAFFLKRSYGFTDSEAAGYSIAFDLCGIPGVYVTGWLSDRYFGSRRAGVALAMMIGMTGATALLMAFGDTSAVVFIVLLGLVGFTLYGPDALLTGAGAIDIGGRRAATFAAGVISGFGSLGPVVQELVIARMYDSKSGDLGPVFAMLFGSAAAAAAFCAVLVIRNRRGGKGI